MTQAAPDGFDPMAFDPDANFIGVNGPLYRRIGPDGLRLGFRVAPRHCNLAMVCHGGMLTTLADMQLSLGARHAAGLDLMLPTVSLSIDFMGPVGIGCWVEGSTELLTTTRTLVFAQCRLFADGLAAVRANGVFRQAKKVEALSALDPGTG
jgi:uncharacterized protein (TIGR00369 family)